MVFRIHCKLLIIPVTLCFCFVAIIKVSGDDIPCLPLDFGEGSVVCVCNSTYCDTITSPKPEEKGNVLVYTSNKDGVRFKLTRGKFGPITDSLTKNNFVIDNSLSCLGAGPIQLVVNRSVTYQQVYGFGGAFTDTTGINLQSLVPETRAFVLQSYFGPKGIGYSMGRVPIGGTDFSDRCYSYDDIKSGSTDLNLTHFQLQPEDVKYKIPFVQEAIKLTSESKLKLKLVASPWSAPAWMKTNKELYGRGTLEKQYYGVWAEYLIKFLTDYSANNVTFWAVTTQNEPTSGFIPFYPFNCMGWTPSEQRDWVKGYLGPMLANSTTFSNVKIIIFDDIRPALPLYAHGVLSDPEASKYVSGLGIHWYWDSVTPLFLLTETHEKYPQKFLLYTEACNGAMPTRHHVVLGSWERAESYAKSIIDDLNSWVTGWIDWNLVVDETGGPSWMFNRADSPIVVGNTTKVFYKQPMFFAMGHVSKFIVPDSAVVQLKGDLCGDDVKAVAAQRPDGAVVVVFMNKGEIDMELTLTDPDRGSSTFPINKRSIQTIIYW